jgi:hypothetical protein
MSQTSASAGRPPPPTHTPSPLIHRKRCFRPAFGPAAPACIPSPPHSTPPLPPPLHPACRLWRTRWRTSASARTRWLWGSPTSVSTQAPPSSPPPTATATARCGPAQRLPRSVALLPRLVQPAVAARRQLRCWGICGAPRQAGELVPAPLPSYCLQLCVIDNKPHHEFAAEAYNLLIQVRWWGGPATECGWVCSGGGGGGGRAGGVKTTHTCTFAGGGLLGAELRACGCALRLAALSNVLCVLWRSLRSCVCGRLRRTRWGGRAVAAGATPAAVAVQPAAWALRPACHRAPPTPACSFFTSSVG